MENYCKCELKEPKVTFLIVFAGALMQIHSLRRVHYHLNKSKTLIEFQSANDTKY